MTKTESLADVLRDLEPRIPELILASSGHYAIRNSTLYVKDNHAAFPDLLLGLCIGVCEARGWDFRIDLRKRRVANDGKAYWADIYTPHDKPYPHNASIYNAGAETPALALATALRDALEAAR